MFHDVFGHVPLLSNKAYVDFFKGISDIALKYIDNQDAITLLGKIYWFTIEFGLMQQTDGLRAYGAGILSSSGELQYAVNSPVPQRQPLNPVRTMRTRYKIDSYQQTYFVIDCFQQLFDMTAPDFTPLYAQVKALPEILAGRDSS